MALVATDLAALIAAQLALEFTPSTAQATSYVPQEQWMQLATAIANAVIPYIQANAIVLPGSFTSPVGPVTGTGMIA